ncbi:hypothetical protein NEOLEDRAFT_679688 [Neolentinus lepideus HHB14362 ss-1]|uniref:Uncharacterized protein n=1 Tax=Neolentinus lepideus HHB14362 ss-1 TaxID=1314782 RepID=A0A165Q9J9_9AGAM|nr:hypothetical protein NEOLEDRAFT_679688 [Neolentinus lepideus HHB14362 ss-1]
MGDKLSTGNVFEDNIGGTLRRQPSLLDLDLNTSSKSRNTALPEYGIPSGRKTRVVVRHDSSNEVIPDSEEERVRARGSLAKEVPKVIEISSDSEDEQPRRLNDDKSKDVPAAMPVTTFGRATPALLGEDTIDSSTTTHVSDSQEVSSLRKEPEVIELTDSEPEPVKERPKPRPRLEVNTTRPPPPAGPRLSTPKMLPLYADEEPWEADDGSILTLSDTFSQESHSRSLKCRSAFRQRHWRTTKCSKDKQLSRW